MIKLVYIVFQLYFSPQKNIAGPEILEMLNILSCFPCFSIKLFLIGLGDDFQQGAVCPTLYRGLVNTHCSPGRSNKSHLSERVGLFHLQYRSWNLARGYSLNKGQK